MNFETTSILNKTVLFGWSFLWQSLRTVFKTHAELILSFSPVEFYLMLWRSYGYFYFGEKAILRDQFQQNIKSPIPACKFT